MKMDDSNDDLRKEYDFSKMQSLGKGKYVQKCKQGTNIIHLEPDVAAFFHDDETVNSVLRVLINIAKERVPSK